MQGISLHRLATPDSFTPTRAFWVCMGSMVLLLALSGIAPQGVRLQMLYAFPLGGIALHCASRRLLSIGLCFALACQVLTAEYLGLSTLGLVVDTQIFAVMALSVVSLGRAGRKSHLQVLGLASRDALTGLLNRRSFESHLLSEVNRQKRFGGHFSLAIMDLDKFKGLNDTQGHKAGDTALQHFADLLLRRSRRTDAVFRLGGDEFALLMPGAAKDDAIAHCQVICRELHHNMALVAFDVTCSIGVASFLQAPDSVDAAVLLADRAMYVAKAQQSPAGSVVGV